jgi:hypothetical protein
LLQRLGVIGIILILIYTLYKKRPLAAALQEKILTLGGTEERHIFDQHRSLSLDLEAPKCIVLEIQQIPIYRHYGQRKYPRTTVAKQAHHWLTGVIV